MTHTVRYVDRHFGVRDPTTCVLAFHRKFAQKLAVFHWSQVKAKISTLQMSKNKSMPKLIS
jgi:hypothetical protein